MSWALGVSEDDVGVMSLTDVPKVTLVISGDFAEAQWRKALAKIEWRNS